MRPSLCGPHLLHLPPCFGFLGFPGSCRHSQSLSILFLLHLLSLLIIQTAYLPLLSAFLPPSFLFLPSSFLPSFVLSFLSCLKCHFSLSMPILAELLQAAKKICSTSMFVSSKVFKICFTSGFLHLR